MRRRTPAAAQIRDEWRKCARSFPYWCRRYVHVYDAATRAWLPFRLWPSQVAVAEVLQAERLVVMLKARQLGMSWLVTAYGLWLMVFRPAATVLLFSKRDMEAVHLLAFRLRGMYRQLPAVMQAREVLVDNAHELRLSNGSAALAFSTTGGRSYTGTFALVDEADHCTAGRTDALDVLLDAVKPTIDGGGQLVLLSTVDKRAPGSAFKRIYEAAKATGAGGAVGSNGYVPVFLPWSARPDRTGEWYEAVRRDIQARSGSLDSLYAEYPATDVEALAALSSDARFATEWCRAADATTIASSCLSAGDAQHADTRAPSLNGLARWETPRAGRLYVIGADPAEGNPQSDESAACVMDAVTGDQVAVWAGRFEPATFAGGLASLAGWIETCGGHAGVLVERNNHGHAVLLALRHAGVAALRGLDGQPGWLTTAKGKALAVDAGADLLRDGALACGPGAAGRSPKVRDMETLRQLAAFSGATLAAPAGDHDDRCMAWCLAAAAARYCPVGTGEAAVIPPAWQIDTRETGGW